MGEAVEVVVYKSRRVPGTYIYMAAEDEFESLPDALRARFRDPQQFLTFELSATRYLAQADPQTVLFAIREQGFYLQLPPRPEPEPPQ